MEAGDYQDPIFLNFEKYSVGKASHSGTATTPVDNRKLQGTFRYCFYRGFDCQCETLAKLRTNLVIPRPRFQQILIRI